MKFLVFLSSLAAIDIASVIAGPVSDRDSEIVPRADHDPAILPRDKAVIPRDQASDGLSLGIGDIISTTAKSMDTSTDSSDMMSSDDSDTTCWYWWWCPPKKDDDDDKPKCHWYWCPPKKKDDDYDKPKCYWWWCPKPDDKPKCHRWWCPKPKDKPKPQSWYGEDCPDSSDISCDKCGGFTWYDGKDYASKGRYAGCECS